MRLSEVQDALISILSEKRLSVPELLTEIPAQKGFSIIATANTRDRGVNDMSAALKRRFNIVVLPTPGTLETEIDIVRRRIRELAVSLELRAEVPTDEAVEKVVTIFRELRTGQTLDGKNKLKTPSGVLSTAEAISVLANSTGGLRVVSARAKSRPTTWPPACKARSSKTKRRIEAPGRSI